MDLSLSGHRLIRRAPVTAHMSTDEGPTVGDSEGIGIESVEDGQFDFSLTGPERGEFGFDAAEVQEIRDLLDRTLGDG